MPTNEYDDFARADAGVSATEGLLTPGNIDLSTRPVVRNDDGTISTVRSMSFNEDGQEILIPTVAADGSGILDDSAAVAQYRRTGQHLGKFDTPDHATRYAQQLHAQQLHEQQATEYGPGSANDDYAQMATADAEARDVAVQATVNKALYTMPDDAATVKNMADRSGLPEPVVERNRDEVSRVLRLRDIRQALADSPILTRQMTDPEFARLAHDDVESLSAVEREFGVMRETPRPEPTVMNYMRGLWSSLTQGAEQMRLGTELQSEDLLGDGSADSRIYRENLLRQYRQAEGRIEATTPAFETETAQGIYGGFSSLLQQLPGLAAAIATRNPYLALGYAGWQVQTQSYGKYRARGGTPGEAFLGGTAEGALEAATELLPMGFLVNRFGKEGTKAFLGGLLLRELPSEQIATFTQDAVDTAIANPTKTWGDFFSERGSAAYQTALATLVQSGALAGTHSLARRVVGDSLKVQESAQGAGFLARLTELARASKTAQRTPDTFEKFVAEAAEDGPVKEVYITADALMQSGLADQVAAVSPAVAAQLPLASQTGGQIAIPVEEYAAHIASTEFNQGLLDHLKTDPDGFSQAEARTYLQSQREELEQEVEKAAQDQQAVDAFRASADAVRAQVKAQLEATGRFTPQVNDAYAALWANFFSGQAARLEGATPEGLFKQYYPTVVAENVAAGPVLDQTAPENSALSAVNPNILKQSRRKRDDYTIDMFGVPDPAGTTETPGPAAPEISGDVHPQGTLSRDDAPGRFANRTILVEDTERKIGASQVTNAEEAAQALAYLGRGAVERFDALVTDANGKPLAIVGSFKGAISQASVFPATLAGEAFRVPGAAHLWAAHNHPSGNPTLSPADINLTRALGNIFRGSDIQLHGLFAISGSAPGAARQWTLVDPYTSEQSAGIAAPSKATMSVPAVDRIYSEKGQLGPAVTTPAAARSVIPRVAGNQSGLVLLDTQLTPIGFMPLQPNEMGVLRRDGRMDALYRAISMANASAAMFVNRDGAYTTQQVGNVAGLLNSLDVRVLDVLDVAGDTVQSQAEQGASFSGTKFDQTARGSFNPSTNTIALLQAADLSTFLHESGHFFLEVQTDIAGKLRQQAEIFGADTLKPEERQLLADTDALMQWFGVGTLTDWYSMDLEQKRTYHEQFARGFESYLFEGKAPSIELQGLFQRFRAWLLSVYKDLKALNVTLTDDVRSVFDRMLATNDQITLAEQGRSMMPLFESAEQAGMTPDEFAAYQALGSSATADAIQDLQAKGLRDMQWLHNARGRVLKDLQKEAAARRSEVRMEARREILNEPVYRAWQFLTGKIGADDKIAPRKDGTTGPDLDPVNDSLFVAIAKLGGIDREEAKSQWGVDHKEVGPGSVFGKPILRKTGGRTLDDMRQALIEQGYLSPEDATGDWNPREFEDRFDAELRGDTQYSLSHDFAADQDIQAGGELANPTALSAGRLDAGELSIMNLPQEVLDALNARKMVAKHGLHPDIVAALPGIEMTSGAELVQKLAEAQPLHEVIEAATDVKMLERYGDLSSPEAIARAADKAVHNEARARFSATEAEVLQRLANPTAPTGKIDRRGRAVSRGILLPAAREFAQNVIARVRVRDLRPAQYANAEARAAQNAVRAAKAGDVMTAAAEKRNQVIQQQLTKATYDAQDEVGKAVRYLRKFDNAGTRKSIDADYLDQIDQLLERFDLRASVSNKEAARRKSLLEWVQAQQELGFDPDVPDVLLARAQRKPYRELTVTELRGVLDTVKQIEHLGRLKNRLLTAADNRAFSQIVDEISASIQDNAKRTVKERRTSDRGRLADIGSLFRNFTADHRKFASLVREMDGWQDGGSMWEYLAQSMNRAGDREAVMREQATIALSNLLKPILKTGKLDEKTFFRSVGKSFTREERIGLALNMGNETNRERLVSGEGLPPAVQREILDTLTKEEMDFVQSVWDYLDTYWSEIVAKQRRVQGITSEKVQALPVETKHGTYRGGYYPIKYDALRSSRAEADTAAEVQRQIEHGLYSSSTTRRGHEKARAASVGRPMRYDLGVIMQHVDQVVHDLSWHEYLIDANRLLKAPAIDKAIRAHYGPEVLRTMRETLTDIAVGNLASQSSGERILSYIRKGATITGLGWRLTTSLMQPLGLSQSIVRVGAKWVARGAWRWFGDAAHFENSVRKINEKSDFMRLRAKTMQREINEIRNRVKGKDSRLEASYFYLIQKAQLMADVPTWWGQYEKAMAEDGMTEERAAAQADQAVRDTQGGGQTGDLSKVQRGSAGWMLFTNFYSFFNTTYNLTAEAVGRTDFKKPGDIAMLGADLLLLYTIPALLGTIVHSAFAGDWDDKDFYKKLAYDQLSYLLGTMVVVREAGSAVSGLLGMYSDYSGPAAVRFFGDLARFSKQAGQGDADEAFWKSLNSLGGLIFHYPAGQINSTLQGINAMLEGRTSNPGALVVGPPRK